MSATTGNVEMAECDSQTSIFHLPDDLLMNVFTYITDIRRKLKLEQVCKRFHVLSSKPASWMGIHDLYMKMDDVILDGEPSNISISQNTQHRANHVYFQLNHFKIPFEKWSKAAELLLQRTTIRKILVLVIGRLKEDEEDSVSQKDFMPMSALWETFEKYSDRMKLEWIDFEINCMTDPYDTGLKILTTTPLKSLLQMSIPFLQHLYIGSLCEFQYCREYVSSCFDASIWPLVKQCTKLKSFIFSTYGTFEEDFFPIEVLEGKALKELKVEIYNNEKIWPCQQIVDVMNNSETIESLVLYNTDAIYGLNKGLSQVNDTAGKSLKYLKINNYSYGCLISPLFEELHFIPSLFPNLEKLYIAACFGIFQAFLPMFNRCGSSFLHFFQIAHNGPINRKISISDIRYNLENMSFKNYRADLIDFCRQNNIEIRFKKRYRIKGAGETVEDFKVTNYCQKWAVLSKGKVMIRICIERTEKDDSDVDTVVDQSDSCIADQLNSSIADQSDSSIADQSDSSSDGDQSDSSSSDEHDYSSSSDESFFSDSFFSSGESS